MNDMIEDTMAAPETVETFAARPADLPDKFWDPEAGQVRVDALAKSYGELERHFGAGSGIPESPDAYDIPVVENGIPADPEVNARLHGAGFTNDQVRLVYELANEVLPAMASAMASESQFMRDTEHLERHYGGPERWAAMRRQLTAWGKAKLPPQVFDALAHSPDGILALERMMQSGEPGLAGSGDPAPGMGEEDLKQMMRDPRYWREQDPVLVGRVRDGFKRLYPDKQR